MGRAGPIKLGLRPDSGRVGQEFNFFKVRGQPMGFILSWPDGLDGPMDDGQDGPRMTGLTDLE